MSWMSKLATTLSLLLITINFSACGAPDYPKEDVINYSYKNKISSDFLLKDTLCLADVEKDVLNYELALYSLHSYLKSLQTDIYSDTELSASTSLVELISVEKHSDGCYGIETKISVEAQKQLSVINMDVLYAKIPMDKTLVKTYRNVGHAIYGYIVAMRHIPNLEKITSSHYYQYYAAKASIKTYNGTTNAKHLENINESSISYGLKDTVILHHSYDIDQIKVRYFANTVNKKYDDLNRIYNSNLLVFTKKDKKQIRFTEPFITQSWSVEDFFSTMKKLDTTLDIEVQYTLQVPEDFITEKVYLSNTLDSKMFDLYCNDKLMSSSTQAYIAAPVKDKLGKRIVQIVIKTKNPININEYQKYLKELANRPNMIGEYKRGGLSHMKKAVNFVQK